MTSDFTTLAEATNAIRSKSDGLENVNTKTGTLQNVKAAQIKIDSTYAQFMTRVNSHISICDFLNIDLGLDFSEVDSKLTKAKTWLISVANDWDATALSELHEALFSMKILVQEKLDANWKAMVDRIQVAKTRLGFIGTPESTGYERALRLFDARTTPESMPGSIAALKKAEELIARDGIENVLVEKFLRDASSSAGASFESMNEPEVKAWLDEENRCDKFVIKFQE